MDEREIDREFEWISVKPSQNIYIFSLFLFSLSTSLSVILSISLSLCLSLPISLSLLLSLSFSLFLFWGWKTRIGMSIFGWWSSCRLDRPWNNIWMKEKWTENSNEFQLSHPKISIFSLSSSLSLSFYLSVCHSLSLSVFLLLSLYLCYYLSRSLYLYFEDEKTRIGMSLLGWRSSCRSDRPWIIYGWEEWTANLCYVVVRMRYKKKSDPNPCHKGWSRICNPWCPRFVC